jgi:hypothetical protein
MKSGSTNTKQNPVSNPFLSNQFRSMRIFLNSEPMSCFVQEKSSELVRGIGRFSAKGPADKSKTAVMQNKLFNLKHNPVSFSFLSYPLIQFDELVQTNFLYAGDKPFDTSRVDWLTFCKGGCGSIGKSCQKERLDYYEAASSE